jgi:cell division protease FtsH
LEDICISCAGRVAEEVFFGSFDTGWWGDLETITAKTKNMITRYGMSNLGVARLTNPGAEMERLIYEEQNRIINECLERTRKLIEDNKQKFINASEYLLTHKEINEEEFIKEFNKQNEEL